LKINGFLLHHKDDQMHSIEVWPHASMRKGL